MFPPRSLCLTLGLLLWGRFAHGQTVINSTFLSKYPDSGYASYDDPNHWSPAEVPNNTPTKQFNVNIPTFYDVVARASDVMISNLTLDGSSAGILAEGRNFTVTGTTMNLSQDGYIRVRPGPSNLAPRFNAGTLSSFSNHTLRGNYDLGGILQFNGADVWTFRDGSFNLGAAASAIVDEFGNDALRNLARLESSATVYLPGHDLVTKAPFLNEGTLFISGFNGSLRTFTAAAGLKNFDASTKTLAGGSFNLSLAELRFPGADVVNLASVVTRGYLSRIADLDGNDGFRNLAHILSNGSLAVTGSDFTTAGSFSNDGTLTVGTATFTITGGLNNFNAASRTLTGGSYSVSGELSFPDGVLKFLGADIAHNAASIFLSKGHIADLSGNDGLRNLNDNLANGSFTVSENQVFIAPGDFTNAGNVTVDYPSFDNFTQGVTRGEFRAPTGSSYIQTAGATVNGAIFTVENINISGGSFTNHGPSTHPRGTTLVAQGTINGNLNVSNGTLVPGGTINGNLTLGPNARFHSAISATVGAADSVVVSGSASVAGTLEVELPGARFPLNTEVITILQSNGPLTGTFGNAPNGARITTTDGGGSFLLRYESNKVELALFEPAPLPAHLLNISTRAFLSRAADDPAGDRSVLIGGFIITGNEAKKVVVRGIGPSLAKAGISSPLNDPTLELHYPAGNTITANDDWRNGQAAELQAIGLAPQDDREAAVVITLVPGSYTVVIREKSGLAGTGLVEVYDVSGSANSRLGNISTRGFVDSANVLIGGIIAGGPGESNAEVVVRAVGRLLKFSGLSNALGDTMLELRDANGNLIGSNDNYLTNIEKLPPGLDSLDSTDSALRASLPRGNYTAIVRAKPDRSGVALVEFYDLRASN